ncbi:pineapple eye protein-like [Anopheles cruzii]|uniref:pineapple eye protein-like n=1 Tax=Anopheles cruzii TaxID=68878 RepID=UPI0022EC2B20|nr:pineapple eye protein-like [Anopheles cruzii]
MDHSTKSCGNVSFATDPKFKVDVLKAPSSRLCDICLLNDWDPVRYGELVVKKWKTGRTLACHYFCLLSGTLIPQCGSDTAGIFGFLLRDILDAIPKFRSKRCVYCNRLSASIQCKQDGCDKWYHYSCGYNNYCVTEFTGQYDSYCHEHLPEEFELPPMEGRNCNICFEDFAPPSDTEHNPVAIVVSNCSAECPVGTFHRECLQRFAFNAGYNFRCPNCFDKNYKHDAALQGIFVPQRESSWEREAGAFKDLHKRRCTAKECTRRGTYNEKSVASMVGCKVCGGMLMHKSCTELADPREYVCELCFDETFIRLL